MVITTDDWIGWMKVVRVYLTSGGTDMQGVTDRPHGCFT